MSLLGRAGPFELVGFFTTYRMPHFGDTGLREAAGGGQK
jgi:hypothetical protein